MKIENLKVYDFKESIIASGYPMKTDITEKKSYDLDLKRGVNLASTPSNSGHGNFLSGIRVSFDLTISNAMLVQLERYNFLDIVSSQSKMHRLAKYDLSACFSEWTSKEVIEEFKSCVTLYNTFPTIKNKNRMIHSCPMGCELTMRVSTNYMQLKNIISQRKNHALFEWQEFCEYMMNNLPMAKEFLGVNNEK